MPELRYQESIGDLVKGILNDLRQLIRDEAALARAELREQVGRAKLAVGALGAAAAALIFGSAFLLVAIAMAAADLLDWPTWAGFLLVAVVLSIGGMLMFSTGRRRLRTVHPVPEQTVQTLKENSEWIARRLSSVKE